MCGAEVTALPEDQQLERQLAIKTLASREASVRAVTVNVPSPCVSVCRMDAGSGLCEGCFRTIEENTGVER